MEMGLCAGGRFESLKLHPYLGRISDNLQSTLHKDKYSSVVRHMESLGVRVAFPLQDTPGPDGLKYEGQFLHSIACLLNPLRKAFVRLEVGANHPPRRP